MEFQILEQNENEPDIVFTRYLYIKQEVKLALLASLLNKSYDALFWAYELYYSGFVYELLELIFKIYYDFYAVLGSSFEPYLIKKANDILRNYNRRTPNDDKLIGAIIRNMLERPFNTDVFMLQNICNIFDVECIDPPNIKEWINNDEYLTIAQFVLREQLDPKDIYRIVLDVFEENGLQINKSKLMTNFVRSRIVSVDTKQLLLSKIMELFARKHGLIMGKNKYATFDVSETILYETLNHNAEHIKCYNVLEHVCKIGVNDANYLCLFDLGRNKLTNDGLRKLYNVEWIYYASWSQFWAEKIGICDGKINYEGKQVVFDEETDMCDKFHDNYDYEPDEQPIHVKNKSVMSISANMTWRIFYERHKNEHLFELDEDMLDEISQMKLKYIK